MIFEDEFSGKQTDMISLALEYVKAVGKKVDMIYIYGSHENNMYIFDLFFKVENNLCMIHQLADNIDQSLMFQVLQLGNQDLQALDKICQKYQQPTPTQIKLVYDVTKNSVDAHYSYDNFYSDSDTLTPDDIFNQWFEEVKAEVEK